MALSDDPGKAGAGYVRSSDLTWQQEVRALCEHAEGIFVVPFDFEGTAWEVEMLMEHGWLAKTFFVMPAAAPLARWLHVPWYSRDYRAYWEAGRVRYAMLELPEYDDQGAVVLVGEGRRIFRGFGHRAFSWAGEADRQRREPDLETLRARLAELSDGNTP